MHYREALDAYHKLKSSDLNYSIRWISRAVSCLLAAGSVVDRSVVDRIEFEKSVQGYAAACGLQDALSGNYSSQARSGKQGSTYSRLTRLTTHSEVEACNTVINDLIFEQFSGFSVSIVTLLGKVVGELHDNVASHANGVGFSAAQVYDDGGSRRIEFAIIDAGCGMLKNVRIVNSMIATDPEAIDWCLKRGNTTAKAATDGWEQRVPEDMAFSPFPQSTNKVTSDNHHLGEGLWTLSELIRITNGSLWILSGAGEYRYLNGRESVQHSSFTWPGVAIEFELIVPKDSQLHVSRESDLERLGKRLGI